MTSIMDHIEEQPPSGRLECEPDHTESIGPTCARSLQYKGQLEDEHRNEGPVYLRPQLKGEYYDHILLHNQLAQSERYGLLGARCKYTYLKKFAVERLQETLRKQLTILHDQNKCEEPNEDLAHGIFSWSMKDFLKRRHLQDFVWVDVLQMSPEPCLDVYKFKQDLEQLQTFLQPIFKGLLSNTGGEEVDAYEHIEKPIREAFKVLEISHNIDLKFEENKCLLRKLQLQDSVFAHIQRDSVDNMRKIFLETRILNSHIWIPIEVRYQLSWYNSQVKQFQYRMENMLESRQREVDKYQQMSARETRVSGSSLDFYYSNIEALKTQIQLMQAKFDREYDLIENRLAQKRAQNGKVQDQKKFLTEEIQRFHDESERMRLREEREAQVREKKRLEEEALALAKKQRKLKKKGRNPFKNNKTEKTVKSFAKTQGKFKKK